MHLLLAACMCVHACDLTALFFFLLGWAHFSAMLGKFFICIFFLAVPLPPHLLLVLLG